MAERRRSRTLRVVRWILALLVLAAAVLFALENRGSLALNFWPTGYVLTLPIYLAVFATVVTGFVLGGIVTWMAGGRRRAEQREAERWHERMRRENEELRRRAEAAETAARNPALAADQARRQLVVANS